MAEIDADAAATVFAMRTLRELTILRAALDPPLGDLAPGIEELHIPRTALSDADLSGLARLASLQQLTFDPSAATALALLELRRALPELTINGEWQAPRLVARALTAVTSVST
jgi:hypothetical protein